MQRLIGFAAACPANVKRYYVHVAACAILAAIVATIPINLQNRLIDWLFSSDTLVEA